jgi:hypothetical protein
MAKHVGALLARSLEEALSSQERTKVDSHVASCRSCAQLRRELSTTAGLLEQPETSVDLPALDLRRAPGRAAGRTLAFAAVALTGATVVIVAAGILSMRAIQPVAASPSVSPPTTEARPYLLLAHRAVIDTGPGGTPIVVTQAFDAFRILAADGSRTDHALSGVAVGSPAFDGASRVAYWSRTTVNSGTYRLAVWSVTTRQERTLLTLADEAPSGDPVWTADGRAVIAATRTAAGDHVRMLRVDAAGAGSTVVADTPAAVAIGPIYADESVIVGLRAQSYVVLDARTGQVRSETPVRQPRASEFIATRAGTVAELVRTFEAEPGPLRIWAAASPDKTLAAVEQRGIDTPLFWPGRSEVVFVRGTTVDAIDYLSGATRTVVDGSDSVRLLAFDISGDLLAVQTGNRITVFERSGADLHVRTDLQFAEASASLGEVIGVFR